MWTLHPLGRRTIKKSRENKREKKLRGWGGQSGRMLIPWHKVFKRKIYPFDFVIAHHTPLIVLFIFLYI